MDCECCGTFLIVGAVYGHGYGWVVVFEAWEVVPPDFTSAEVAIVDFAGEVEVDLLYVAG